MSTHLKTILGQPAVAGIAVVAILLFGSSPAAPQSGHNLKTPPTWKARYDDGSAGGRYYEVMRPGWHIHAGPAGIFWDPGRFATGNYSVTSTIFLFPPGTGDPPSSVDTPYGLLLGGDGLDRPSGSYVTFMLRNDGRFSVARHRGLERHELVPWTPSDAISIWTENLEGTAKNVVVVDAMEDDVIFWVNDMQVASLPRADLPVEGTVGLRAGEGLSLHITAVTIGPNRR